MMTVEQVTERQKDLALKLGDLKTALKLSWLELTKESLSEIEACKELVDITLTGK